MAWFGGKSIRARVLEAVEAKIAEGQSKFDDLKKEEDARLANGIKALQDSHVAAVDAHADSIVKDIVR